LKQTKVILLSCVAIIIVVFYGVFLFLHEPTKVVLAAGVVISLVAVGGWCLFLYYAFVPPKEGKLIRHFNEHRAAFEQLCTMLLADGQVREVAGWGVSPTASPGRFRPPEGFLTNERYQQYLALLRQAGGRAAFHREAESPRLGIVVWSRGHVQIAICYAAEPPGRQVTSLDGYYQQRRRDEPGGVFRPIEGPWYLWTDW
jgi:hypothetical protein